jgi:hypothetical protein
LALNGSEWQDSTHNCFTTGKRDPGTYQKSVCVPELIWSLWQKDTLIILDGNLTPVVQHMPSLVTILAEQEAERSQVSVEECPLLGCYAMCLM